MLFSRSKNYLIPESHNINFFKDNIYITNYKEIDCISEKMLIIKFVTFNLKITGNSFTIIKLLDHEILFKGQVEKAEFEYI